MLDLQQLRKDLNTVVAGLARLRGRGTGRIAWLGFGALCATSYRTRSGHC